jgi:hypothetical protein
VIRLRLSRATNQGKGEKKRVAMGWCDTHVHTISEKRHLCASPDTHAHLACIKSAPALIRTAARSALP